MRLGPEERFYTVEEVAGLFKQTPQWVYRNRWGFLRPAARRFHSRLLLFDKAEIERIISAAKEACPLRGLENDSRAGPDGLVPRREAR